jgi:hypothetical protein
MTSLADAIGLRVGTTPVAAVYAGSILVWTPPSDPTDPATESLGYGLSSYGTAPYGDPE